MGTLSPSENFFGGIRRKWMFPPWNAKSDNSFFSLTVETPLNIKIQWGNAVYFKCIKIDVFSAENISLYAKFCHIFSALKTSIFLPGKKNWLHSIYYDLFNIFRLALLKISVTYLKCLDILVSLPLIIPTRHT